MKYLLNPSLQVVFLLCLAATGHVAFPEQPFHGDRQWFPVQRQVPADTLRVPPPVRDSLAPGTAKVRAKIIKLDTSARDIILTVRIKKIVGYGSATPPLASGREVDIDATSFFTRSTQSHEWIEPCAKVVVVIDHIPALQMDRPAPAWRLVEVVRHMQSKKDKYE